MSDDLANKREQVNRIAKELSDGRLSRRSLFDRLKGLGVGFGAAFMLGMKGADAHNAPAGDAATATLKSTNAALNAIIEEAPQAPTGEGAAQAEDRPVQTAYYHRVFRRAFRRVYNRY
jgi:hypothetical protein